MRRKKNQFSEEDCIKDLQNYVAEHDNIVPHKEEFIANSLTGSAFGKYFNRSFNEFVEAAGFQVRVKRSKITKVSSEEAEASRLKDYGPKGQEIIQDFLDVKEAFGGRIPTVDEFLEYSNTKRSYVPIFGGYGNLVRAAGFEYTITRTRKKEDSANKESEKHYGSYIPDEDVKKDIERIAVEHPEITQISKLLKFGKYGSGTYYSRFNGSGTIANIINIARRRTQLSKPKVNPVWQKRYSIKYYPAPVILKWAHRRPIKVAVGK